MPRATQWNAGVEVELMKLGFRRQGRHWTHPDSPYWVDLPPGPVQVGDAVVSEFAELRTRLGTLCLLAPTECVMDRLAGYYHWGDPQCLEQAIEVARCQSIDGPEESLASPRGTP